MVLLDTNIFIYLCNGRLDRRLIADTDIAYATITKIEALGFPDIRADELLLLRSLFAAFYALDLTDAVVERAIALRQLRRMSLGDAIIAATACEHALELWTANTADFAPVEGLRLVNPLDRGAAA